jgi:hypothetical protein
MVTFRRYLRERERKRRLLHLTRRQRYAYTVADR